MPKIESEPETNRWMSKATTRTHPAKPWQIQETCCSWRTELACQASSISQLDPMLSWRETNEAALWRPNGMISSAREPVNWRILSRMLGILGRRSLRFSFRITKVRGSISRWRYLRMLSVSKTKHHHTLAAKIQWIQTICPRWIALKRHRKDQRW